MPFGLPYNEAANPRAAPVRAWLTAAATTVTCQHCHTFHLTHCQTSTYQLNDRNFYIGRFISTLFLHEWLTMLNHGHFSKLGLTHLLSR